MIIEMKCFDGGRAILFVGDEAAALREWEDGCEPDEMEDDEAREKFEGMAEYTE